MSEDESMTLAELVEAIEAHPPDDNRRALAQAVRETEAGKLTCWMLVGEDDDQHVDYLQVVAIGFVAEAFPPKYCLIPGVDDAESQDEIDGIVEALADEKPIATPLESVRHLQHDPIRTLAYAALGRARLTGERRVVLWHHPKLALKRAAYLALTAIGSDEHHRLKRGN